MLKPTAEQQAIIDFVVGRHHLRVLALAGCTKTTTLEMVAQALGRLRILYLAFNKTVADEARRRFPRNVDARTGHSLAWKAVGYLYAARLTNSLFALRAHFPRWAERSLSSQAGFDKATGLAVVVQTLTAFLHSPEAEPGATHIPPVAVATWSAPQRASGEAAVLDVVRYFWREMARPDGTLPVTHDVYFKVWDLQHPRLPYDVILLDEAQDADPVLLDVLRHQSAQLVFVGDPQQAIYGWRGAKDALATWKGATLPLTQSFRFGPTLVEPANVVLERLGSPQRLIGAGPSALRSSREALIARTTIGLIDQAVLSLDAREKIAIAGGAEPLALLLEGAYALRNGRRPRHPDLALFRTWRDLTAAAQTPAGAEFQPLIRFLKREKDRVPRIAERLRRETLPEEQAHRVLTTAHKAKGREWAHVTCAADFRWPQHPEDREEAHLIYVTLTRAQHQLVAPDLLDLVAHAPSISDLASRELPVLTAAGA